MTSVSGIINKDLRRVVSPALRAAGFDHVDARNGWAWRANLIWVFNIRAVGRYFSEVTGWPPSSVGVWLGIFYMFMPELRPDGLKTDKNGRLMPAEAMCHMRTHLETRIDQGGLTRKFPNPAERRRRDIWWVDPDGGNAYEVAQDIAGVFTARGLPWLDKHSDPRSALAEICTERDCYHKYYRVLHLARFVGDQAVERKYSALEEKERLRIGIL